MDEIFPSLIDNELIRQNLITGPTLTVGEPLSAFPSHGMPAYHPISPIAPLSTGNGGLLAKLVGSIKTLAGLASPDRAPASLQAGSRAPRQSLGWQALLTANYWKSYFDFSQATVVRRLLTALTLRDLGSQILDNPDLVNPLGINLFLTLAVFITSNINRYLFTPQKASFRFDFSCFQRAFSTVVTLLLCFPAIFSGFFYFSNSPLSAKKIVAVAALYSYSNIFYILASLFAFLPFNFLVWSGFLLATAAILLFLNVNFYHFTHQLPPQSKTIAFGLLAGLTSLTSLLYKLRFY